MRHAPSVIACIATLFTGGCATQQFQDIDSTAPVVPIDVVIDSIKCGLAKAVVADKTNRSGLFSSTAKVKLQVNIVDGTSITGGVSAGIPISTGASVTPSLTLTNDRTRTNNSEVDFTVDLKAVDLGVCQDNSKLDYDAGFSGWIDQVIVSLDAAVAGNPKVSITTYTYDSDFVVKTDVNAGIAFAIVPLKGNASMDSSRSDVQHLNVAIAAVHQEVKNGKKTVVPGAPPFNPKPIK